MNWFRLMLYYTTFYEITHRPLHIRILYHWFFFSLFLPLYICICMCFFCFLFCTACSLLLLKLRFFPPKSFDFWVMTLQNIDFFSQPYISAVEYCSSFAFGVSFVLSLFCFVSSRNEKDLIFCCSCTMLTFLVFLNILHHSSFSL